MKKIYLLPGVILAIAASGYVAPRIHARTITEVEARKFHCKTYQGQEFSVRDHHPHADPNPPSSRLLFAQPLTAAKEQKGGIGKTTARPTRFPTPDHRYPPAARVTLSFRFVLQHIPLSQPYC